MHKCTYKSQRKINVEYFKQTPETYKEKPGASKLEVRSRHALIPDRPQR